MDIIEAMKEAVAEHLDNASYIRDPESAGTTEAKFITKVEGLKIPVTFELLPADDNGEPIGTVDIEGNTYNIYCDLVEGEYKCHAKRATPESYKVQHLSNPHDRTLVAPDYATARKLFGVLLHSSGVKAASYTVGNRSVTYEDGTTVRITVR